MWYLSKINTKLKSRIEILLIRRTVYPFLITNPPTDVPVVTPKLPDTKNNPFENSGAPELQS